MQRSLSLIAVLIFLWVSSAHAQVTLTYEIAVTTKDGPHATLFPSGAPGTVTYTLDPAAVDSNPDPSRGIFNNAVLSMSVSFPTLGIFANAGSAGLAQTFNDVGTTCSISDQVFIFGGPISSASSLGGETINGIEVDFLSGFVSTPTVPGMLTSDSLPLTELPFLDPFVTFRTTTGNTHVSFSATPRVRVQALISRVEGLVTIGRLTRAQGDRLRNKLDPAISALDRGRTDQASDNLREFISRVTDLIDAGSLSRGSGDFLINGARDIRDQLGF